MDQLYRALPTLCLLVGFVMPAALAQDTELPQVSDSANEPQLIEEITVFGEKTFFGLKLELESAEVEVFNLFNEINSNDDFDVTCTNEIYAGSHIKQRKCMPAFLREEQARNTQNYINGTDLIASLDGVRNEVKQKSAAMEAEMTRLALENRQFEAVLQKLTNLTGAYEKMKKENPLYFGR